MEVVRARSWKIALTCVALTALYLCGIGPAFVVTARGYMPMQTYRVVYAPVRFGAKVCGGQEWLDWYIDKFVPLIVE